jgi:hypothetical protein
VRRRTRVAGRPIFLPSGGTRAPGLVETKLVDFTWSAGFAISQKRKNIAALHDAARDRGLFPLLEVSTKSETDLGRRLSAFNLTLASARHGQLTVEAAFQGSKVFTTGGPYTDLFGLPGREIKRDERLKGRLLAFEFEGQRWQLEPKTAFYDWLYLRAIHAHEDLREQVLDYAGFTDIEFNPKRSLNCQARSCALYVALRKMGPVGPLLAHREQYLSAVVGHPEEQLRLDSTGRGPRPRD